MGGESALRAVIDDFVDRLFADMMIGFMFRRADRQRIKAKEYEFAAAMLGGNVQYTGRPIGQAHASHRIMGGQFARRSQVLRETLISHQVPTQIVELWLEHTERLRPQITRDTGGECTD